MLLVAIAARVYAQSALRFLKRARNSWRGPSYRGADKIFAPERSRNDALALWCKIPDGSRETLLEAERRVFLFLPIRRQGLDRRRLGRGGRLARIEAFIRRSYRLVAPKRLAKLVA
jgi:hypothetical protein